MSTQPSDEELKAMWQIHAADIGGIFYYARAVLAKWGSPVVAGEPYAYAVYFPDQPCEELVHDLDDLTEDLTNREHAITELYTTLQPTQGQAGAVPLTDAQADSIAMAAFEKHCGRLHPWGGAQPWVIAAIKAADGIKGKTT